MTGLSKTYSTFWPLTIVAVVTFVFGGMVVYYTQMARGDNDEMVSAQPLVRLRRKAPAPLTPPQDKSFRDVRAGFSFAYPGSWEQERAFEDSVGFHVVLRGPDGASLSASREKPDPALEKSMADTLLGTSTKVVAGRKWKLLTYEDRADREHAYTTASVVSGDAQYSFTTEQGNASSPFFSAALSTFDFVK